MQEINTGKIYYLKDGDREFIAVASGINPIDSSEIVFEVCASSADGKLGKSECCKWVLYVKPGNNRVVIKDFDVNILPLCLDWKWGMKWILNKIKEGRVNDTAR